MSETITVNKIERSAGAFDFGNEKSDYTIHHEHGETHIQNSYANDLRQEISDKCEELLGDADEVEPDVVIEGHAPNGEIEDHNIKALREVATDGGEVDDEDETTDQQDDVAEWLSTKRLSDESREWTVEVDTINDGRPAVRVSWEPDTDASLPTVDEERLPHGWQIVQFGVGVTSEIGESDDKRYLVIAPQKSNTKPAMYDALARELTASELRDYLAVERFGYSQTGWAKESGLNRSNVSERVNSARRKLSE